MTTTAQPRMSLARLFSLAYSRGFPHSVARDVLRILAEGQFHVPLEKCSDGQLEQLAELISAHRYDPRRDPGARQPAAGEAPARATEAQRDRIRTLGSMLGWSTGTLTKFLQQHFGVARVIDLAQRDQAERCIGLLDAHYRDRARRAANWRRYSAV